LPQLRSIELTAEFLKSVDAVVISTDHTSVDYELVASNAKLIVDTRGVYRKPRLNVIKA
jgi:UDP-N-acetyl-D-glucosamine dehydrogenase